MRKAAEACCARLRLFGCVTNESAVEQERRRWVERQEEFKDLQEAYERDHAAATSPEERRKLVEVFAAQRRAHREEDVRLGRRSPGFSIGMHRIMWATWIEVAVEHELEARRSFQKILSNLHTAGDYLISEFRASLVAVTASAYTIEAVYGDIKYRIPVQDRDGGRAKELRRAFRDAFGLRGAVDHRMAEELSWLFKWRHAAVHPYTELETPAPHPAGPNTGAEHSRFNAMTSGRAVDAAMTILAAAEAPPKALNRWIDRWAADRRPYHDRIDQLRRDRDSQTLPPL